jgi:hypothetical protein
MINTKALFLLPLAGLIVLSVFAGEVEDHFRNQGGTIAPSEYNWLSDSRLQDHGVTEIAFERPKSLDRARWDAYTVKFFSDGRVEFTGYDQVRKMGLHVGRIPTQEFNRLVLLIDQMDFNGLEGLYSRRALGASTHFTSVLRNGQRKTIQNYADAAPVQLWAIELAIQDLVKKITWES